MANEKARDAGQGDGGKKVTADTMDSHGQEHHMIPVWFFVGVLLFIYGILILIQGISEWSHPPNTELSNLHPTFWWSFVLIALGAYFCKRHFPGKEN